jgi:hypothetical protein
MKLMRMLAVAALLASSHLVYGQNETDVMSANVPFAFTAGGVSMPAGPYVISHVQGGQLWKIRTFGRAIYVTSRPRQLRKAPATSVLLFDHDATGYTLLQLQQQARREVAEVTAPNRAKEGRSAAQQVASVAMHAQ